MFEVAKKTIMPYKTVNNLRRIGHFAWYFLYYVSIGRKIPPNGISFPNFILLLSAKTQNGKNIQPEAL